MISNEQKEKTNGWLVCEAKLTSIVSKNWTHGYIIKQKIYKVLFYEFPGFASLKMFITGNITNIWGWLTIFLLPNIDDIITMMEKSSAYESRKETTKKSKIFNEKNIY